MKRVTHDEMLWGINQMNSEKKKKKKLKATAISYSDLISKFGENELKYPPNKKICIKMKPKRLLPQSTEV